MTSAYSGMTQFILSGLVLLVVFAFPAAVAAHDVSGPKGEEVIDWCRSSGGVWDGGCECPKNKRWDHYRCEDRAALCAHNGPNTEYVVKKGYLDCYCVEGYKRDYSAPGWGRCVADGSYKKSGDKEGKSAEKPPAPAKVVQPPPAPVKPVPPPPAPAKAVPSCGRHAKMVKGECVCDPGYTVYTKALGCEPVYCGETAHFDLKLNDCVCNEGYLVGKSGKCISSQQLKEEQQQAREAEQQKAREAELRKAREAEQQKVREAERQKAREAEQQKAREAERQKVLQAEREKARQAEMKKKQQKIQAELKAEADYLRRVTGSEEQRAGKLEKQLGIRQPLAAGQVEAVAYQAAYRDLAAIQEQNEVTREMMLSVGEYREIAKDVQASIAAGEKKLVKDYKAAKQTLDADYVEPSLSRVDLKKRLDDSEKTLVQRSYELLLKSAPEEEQESSWWQRAADGTAALAEFSTEHGLMESETAKKLNWRAGLAKDVGEGNWLDATATLAREGLDNYLKNDGHYKDFVEKWLGRVDWVAEQGEKAKKLTENLSEKVNLAREVAETYERVNKYERVFAGQAAESATALTLGGKLAGKIADHTLGKIPYGGKIIAEGAKTYLEAPGKLVDAVAKIQEKRLQSIDESEVGMDMTGSSEVVEFLRSNAEHRVEDVAPGNQAAGQRITYTLDYDVDGETRTKIYNMNQNRWVKNEKTGFIVPLQGTDGNSIDGELQFRPVDNRTLLIFGCVQMEVWTTEDPPRQILPTPCISK